MFGFIRFFIVLIACLFLTPIFAASSSLSDTEKAIELQEAELKRELQLLHTLPKTQLTPREAKREQQYLGSSEVPLDPFRFQRGLTVTTSPLLGLKSAFDASDLLYEYPSMNEDLILLNQRRYFEHYLSRVGNSLDNRAIVVISGGVEGQIIYDQDFGNFMDSDINLSTGELDILGVMSKTANGFLSLDYDSSAASTGSRVENSRIYLSRGYLTIGNLDASPLYFTIGQMYEPFGKYRSVMLTTPVTKSLARILDRAALLGYYNRGLYAEAYGFQGNKTSGTITLPQQGGVNLGYKNDSWDVGAGWVSNIADSQGMQDNALGISGQFAGFGVTPGGDALSHSVPALDGHLDYNIGSFTLISEFIATTERFATQDLTFNYLGASVKVLHLEFDFSTMVYNRPLTIGLIYGQTWQSLALDLPKNSYAIVFNTSIWKNTMLGLEYRHDVNYGVMADGSVTGAGLPVTAINIGGQRNLVTLQFGAYF